MIQQKAQVRSFILLTIDILIIVFAFEIAYFARFSLLDSTSPSLRVFQEYSWVMNFCIPVWTFLFYYFEFYRPYGSYGILGLSSRIMKANVLGMILLGTFIFVMKLEDVSRIFIGVFGATTLFLLFVVHLGLHLYYRRKRGVTHYARKILLVGTGAGVTKLAMLIARNSREDLELLGIVTDEPDQLSVHERGFCLGRLSDVGAILQSHVVDEVIFSVAKESLDELESAFLTCEELGVRTRIAVNFFPHVISKVVLDDFEGVPLLTFTTTPHDEFLLACKRGFDLIVSSALILGLFPLFVIIGALVKGTSPGPVFFAQKRVGLNGRIFTLYKFRTMVKDAEDRKKDVTHLNELEGPVFKARHDPRVTPIGKFLRKLSWDELPQFFNVFMGHMSVVGPRPPLPEEVEQYKPWQRRRLSMRPGITCVWQISGRNKIVNFDQWMKLDLQYIDSWSMKLDLKIFLKTIPVVLIGRGAS